jgi:Rrf2 family protein
MRLELTRRADYAVRASLALARAGTERLSVRRLAAEQRIPLAFLPRVMSDLVRAGVVEATTGRAGGYRLTRPASEISILDVVQAVEGDVRRRTCVLRGGSCGLDGVWRSIQSSSRRRTTCSTGSPLRLSATSVRGRRREVHVRGESSERTNGQPGAITG